MRKFNFNSFKKNQAETIVPEQKKPRFSAYRTIVSRHDAIRSRLQDEPIATIKSE